MTDLASNLPAQDAGPAAGPAASRPASDLRDALDSLRRSVWASGAAAVVLLLILVAAAAPWIAPHNPLDLATINLADAKLPPAWLDGGAASYLLGTDNQGRDVLSLIFYGLRSSLIVGFGSIAVAMLIGVPVGLIAGFFGGVIDSVLMRIADVQLSFPAILIALLVGGIMHAVFQDNTDETLRLGALILSIALAQWVMFARTVRGLTQIEKEKEYVLAARIMNVGARSLLFRHILPNTLGPVIVLATINIATSILLEATLSFLGVGLPATSPSLGTLIRIGNDYLFSGYWWMALFPGMTLIVLSVAVNVLGDWLRDSLNKRLV